MMGRSAMTEAPVQRQQRSKAEIEAMLVEALRPISDGQARKAEITRADPALYGANWAATGIGGAGGADERAILELVTMLQGKYDVAWE
jgi:hypothetical protein